MATKWRTVDRVAKEAILDAIRRTDGAKLDDRAITILTALDRAGVRLSLRGGDNHPAMIEDHGPSAPDRLIDFLK